MHKLFLLFLLLVTLHSQAQNKPLVYEQQSWAGWNLQVKTSARWGIWFDTETHTADHYFNGFSQSTVRLAGTYYNRNNTKFTVGYGYTRYFPGENHQYISIPEHFGWQQYQWFHNTKKTRLMQWIRLEEKFKNNVIDNYTADNTYTFTYKARYNIFYQIALNREGLGAHRLSLAMGNELYLYYGPHTPNHLFDQDRVFLGFSYAVNNHDNLVFGVLNILSENQAGTQYKDNNILRVTFFENISLHNSTHHNSGE